ncbi:hypothetical protein CRE_26199 [Caenorhabditis remanei]|uniref:Uncharacterized protein n=1 Tax=Caenorhabditis remanei TaxID=31234 RepID=E3LQQ7_CAERE|nr:hypothetical protein CRE_26199 [Caenorhabditis remanei]
MNFWNVIFCITLFGSSNGIQYTTNKKETISESSTYLNVFPADDVWRTATITEDKRTYIESLFSKSFYERECMHDTVLKPVYYYPGEKVRIECVMCNIALVLNGNPKGWARVRNIDDFMEKGETFGSKDGPDIEMVQNADFLEDETETESNETISEPYYHQENGYLVIENVSNTRFWNNPQLKFQANVRSQGVYFCFDEDSVASQRYFHVLIAILPVRHVSNKHINKIKEICETEVINLNSQRIFQQTAALLLLVVFPTTSGSILMKRNVLMIRKRVSREMFRTSIREQGCENPASSCRLPISFPTLPAGIPISISLEWSPWSDCRNTVQTRKGVCFISLDRQISQSDVLTEKYNWLWKLNRMTNNLAFRDGLPIYNSLLASWLYEVDSLESCLDTEAAKNGSIDGYDDFFKNVLNSVFPNKTRKFETPESALKYCIKYEKLDEKYDSLRGTHTEDKRSCRIGKN